MGEGVGLRRQAKWNCLELTFCYPISYHLKIMGGQINVVSWNVISDVNDQNVVVYGKLYSSKVVMANVYAM